MEIVSPGSAFPSDKTGLPGNRRKPAFGGEELSRNGRLRLMYQAGKKVEGKATRKRKHFAGILSEPEAKCFLSFFAAALPSLTDKAARLGRKGGATQRVRGGFRKNRREQSAVHDDAA